MASRRNEVQTDMNSSIIIGFQWTSNLQLLFQIWLKLVIYEVNDDFCTKNLDQWNAFLKFPPFILVKLITKTGGLTDSKSHTNTAFQNFCNFTYTYNNCQHLYIL
jgi:hypothetical protein